MTTKASCPTCGEWFEFCCCEAHGHKPPNTPRQRWGTCCPSDPECEHSFLEADDLTRWMDSPISDDQAKQYDGGQDA